jgi:hypothetical protein
MANGPGRVSSSIIKYDAFLRLRRSVSFLLSLLKNFNDTHGNVTTKIPRTPLSSLVSLVSLTPTISSEVELRS